jgi:hypothetical protein
MVRDATEQIIIVTRTGPQVNRTFEGVGAAKVTVPRTGSLVTNTRKVETRRDSKINEEVAQDVVVGATRLNPMMIAERTDNSFPSDLKLRPGVRYPGLPQFPLSPKKSLLGCRLALYPKNWALITQDSWILDTLNNGLQWPFLSRPPLLRLNRLQDAPQAAADLPAIKLKVRELLLMNTIEKVQETQSPGFYSRFFVVPKKAPGEWRAVLDLMALNQYIPAAKFKMETAESIRRDLNPREWTTSIDLKDAYMHVPIRPSFRKYLRFVVAGQAYQYKALPAGLSLAPWAFTRIIVAVKEFLHRLGINLHQFIDDWLIRALTEQLCACHTEVCLWLLWMLGFYHHPIKSQLVPTRDFIFLGYHYLLVQALLMPTPERWEKISAQIKLFQENQGLPAKQWQRLLGLMAATEKLVPQGLLHMRPIQLALRSAWSQSLQSQQTVVWISPEVRAAIHWWTDPLNVMIGVPLHPTPPQITMYTDASVVGWGAHIGKSLISDTWSSQDQTLHINFLELEAVRLALLHFQQEILGMSVLVATDNTTVVAYINRQGGTKSPNLCRLAEQMLLWTQERQISLTARHIPGKLNVIADLLSREHQVIHTEWMLHVDIFEMLCRLWERPHIDLFATILNHQLPTYISPMPDEQAYGVDALSLSWTSMLAYAFPPFPLLARVIRKITEEGPEVVLIAPAWARQSWFPELLGLLIDHPRQLPRWPNLLHQSRGTALHQALDMLDLHAWKLSSEPSRQRAFQSQLPLVSRSLNENPLWQSTKRDGIGSTLGVCNNRLIRSIPLCPK